MALGLGLLLGNERATARIESDAALVERMIGVDRGRRPRGGLPAWLDGPASEGIEGFARFGSLPMLIENVKGATSEELVASRTLARIMLDGMTAFRHVANAITGVDNPVGFGATSVFRDDPMVLVWLLAFVVGIGSSRTLSENLRSVVDTLSQKVLPVDARARELAALTEDELRAHLPELERLPFIDQVRVKRLVAEYRNDARQGIGTGPDRL
jgi:hypothetical protein